MHHLMFFESFNFQFECSDLVFEMRLIIKKKGNTKNIIVSIKKSANRNGIWYIPFVGLLLSVAHSVQLRSIPIADSQTSIVCFPTSISLKLLGQTAQINRECENILVVNSTEFKCEKTSYLPLSQ